MEIKDLVIIGAGPAGYTAAIRASQLGRKVTLIEKDLLGGTCLNWGCIPSKALLKSAELLTEIKNASRFGIKVSGFEVDFPRIIERSRQVTQTIGRGVDFLMKKNNIEVITGFAKLAPQNKVLLQPSADSPLTELAYTDVILATGARPRLMPNFEPDGEVLHTSRTILASKKLPESLLVIGSGAIGVELAYFFSTLGVKVTLVEMLDQILPLDDSEIAAELQKILTRRGMIIKTASKVSAIKRTKDTVTAMISTPTEDISWVGDSCLLAIGVVPNTEEIGLEEAGLSLSNGFIPVNEKMQTSLPHCYAIGDITKPPLLAHKAAHEGLVAAEVASGMDAVMHYDNIPACSYCRPQVASVGLTEGKLQEAGLEYTVSKIPFLAIGKAQATAETEGFVKLLTSPKDNTILGVHILHPQAAELIAEACQVRTANGTAQDLLNSIHAHPTLSEALSEAAAVALKRPINS